MFNTTSPLKMAIWCYLWPDIPISVPEGLIPNSRSKTGTKIGGWASKRQTHGSFETRLPQVRWLTIIVSTKLNMTWGISSTGCFYGNHQFLVEVIFVCSARMVLVSYFNVSSSSSCSWKVLPMSSWCTHRYPNHWFPNQTWRNLTI